MQTELERVLMERDDISAEKAAELVAAARQQVAEETSCKYGSRNTR